MQRLQQLATVTNKLLLTCILLAILVCLMNLIGYTQRLNQTQSNLLSASYQKEQAEKLNKEAMQDRKQAERFRKLYYEQIFK